MALSVFVIIFSNENSRRMKLMKYVLYYCQVIVSPWGFWLYHSVFSNDFLLGREGWGKEGMERGKKEKKKEKWTSSYLKVFYNFQGP